MRNHSFTRYVGGFVLGAIVTTVAGCGTAVLAQGASGCRPADTERVPHRMRWLQALVSSPDSDYVSTRQLLGLPSMSASKVIRVTKTSTCQTAADALNSFRGEPGTLRQVWLYQLGTSGFAVDDPGVDVTNVDYADRILYFFDKNWVYKRTISGF